MGLRAFGFQAALPEDRLNSFGGSSGHKGPVILAGCTFLPSRIWLISETLAHPIHPFRSAKVLAHEDDLSYFR